MLPITLALVGSTSLGVESPSSPAHGDVADAIALLAKTDREIDVQYISKVLELPNLLIVSRWNGNAFEWSGPVNNQSDDFAANYEPPYSSLGITRLTITWHFDSIFQHRPSVLNVLRVSFAAGHCPSGVRLSEALGVSPTEVPRPGRYLPFISYSIAQAEGEPVQVSHEAENTCEIKIGRFRPL